MLSMALIPVCKGTDTLFLSIMPGASDSMGRSSLVSIGPFPSMGCPKAFTTRPKRASPTGTDTTRPVLLTVEPSLMLLSSDKSATETVSLSRFCAMPKLPSSNSTSSLAIHSLRPYTRAIPSPTKTTVPVSRISIRVL